MTRRFRQPVVLLVPLALLFLVMGLVEAWRDAPTVDETIDIAAGVTSAVRHDLLLNPDHGPLTKLLPALPALAVHPVVPDGPGYASGDWFAHTDEFVRANEAVGRWHRIVFLARLVPLVEGLAVGALLYLLAARLFGPAEGVMAGALWLSTPVFVGFSHLDGIDVPFTLATLLACVLLLRYLDAPSDRRAVAVGLALGAGMLVRSVGLVLLFAVIVVIVVAAWKLGREQLFRRVAIVGVVAWATLWIAMRAFTLSSPGGARGARLDAIISAARGDSFVTRLVLAIPWPKEWAAGLAYVVVSPTSRPAYLLGHAWNGGRWWYFLAAIPLKLPLLAIGVLLVGLFGWRRLSREHARRAALVLVIPAVALYLAVAIQPLNLGLRYAFPTLALWFVAASPIVRIGSASFRRVGLAAFAVTQLVALVAAYPHSLAWTPPPLQPGYRYATDSNIDWGQDAWRAEDWTAGRNAFVDLLLPLGADPPAGSRQLLDARPDEIRGWVAVSATRLMTIDRDTLSWLRAYCPVDTIGGSVLLYRFDERVDVSPGPTQPADLCDGGASRRT